MKLGELFLLGYKPDQVDFLSDFADQYGLGGVILFKHNFRSPENLAEEIRLLNKASGSNLIVCLDQEGGEVVRTENHIPLFPSPRYYAQRDDLEGLIISAQTTARYLRQLGVNLNLVPVCDVLTNPHSALLRRRSFGGNPNKVKAFAGAMIEEYHHRNIGCCCKHFPGLGSAEIDPHFKPAVTDISAEDFENTHWLPFKHCMELNVEMIMTTHLLARSLDPHNLATFSSKIVIDCLRNRLGFKGVVVTDDLGMGAISQDWTPADRALHSLQAGHDMLMFCHQKEEQEFAFNSLLELYNTGKIDMEEIKNKLQRIQNLKQRLEK